MLRDIRKNKIFSRRAFVVGSIQASMSAILLTRLGYLQIFKNKQYSIQSDSNRIKVVINPAGRGEILDRNNISLTKNEQNYRLLIYLNRKRDAKEIVDRLANILKLDQNSQELFLKKITNARRKTIVSLIDNLGWDDLARIETNSYALPGIAIQSGVIRKYLYPHDTAHFLGYVSSPSEKETDQNNSDLFLHPDFKVGKLGLEKSFDEFLRGKYGVEYMEVNSLEIPIKTLSTKPPAEGEKLQLTIDINLQQYARKLIGNNSGSIVVLDIHSGEIITYLSSPSFDSNNFVEGVTKEYWDEISHNPDDPFNNRPISALYPPGSTFKLIVALAALEDGFDPKKKVYCNGHYKLGKRRFHCWKEEGHGNVDLSDAIKHSCNTYFFDLAYKIGYKKFTNLAKEFGYGKIFDIGLSGARPGNVPDDEWKRKTFNSSWVGGDTLNAAVGQGFLLASPLQMAVATARIANGGTPIEPYLVNNHNVQKQYSFFKKNKIAKDEHLDLIKNAMYKVVNEKGGTAFASRLKEFQFAGKTGTSQVVSRRKSQDSEDRIRKLKNHAIFTGFAPFKDPKYAVSVVVEHGGSGSGAAAPIAKKIFKKIYETVYKKD